MPGFWRGLSARLVVLTITFVMIAEVLIYVPSISRFRLDYLEQKIDAAYQATLVVQAAPDGNVAPELARELLDYVGVRSIGLKMENVSALMLGAPDPGVDASFDFSGETVLGLIADAFATLGAPEGRVIRISGMPQGEGDTIVDLTLEETPLRDAMIDYSGRILLLSLIISFFTAALVFLALQRLMVRPVQRMTENLIAFRENPEDVTRGIEVTGRSDEIGIAQRELAQMEHGLREALRQRIRLAAVGAAVSKISHDLRNILSTAALVSDRLSMSDDPQVRRQAPVVLAAIDRAVKLCQDTLRFARAEEPELRFSRFELAPLVDEVGEALADGLPTEIVWRNGVDAAVVVRADRDQMFRVLLNLARNALEAMAQSGGELRFAASRGEGATIVEIADTGPGVAARVQEHLFEAFSEGSRGTGLGLAIARELMRAHGGDLVLVETGPQGTRFAVTLPDRDATRGT
ncbi:MAG: HAMP domain-containing sensor histidine kinase [Proteobacteria bacterium]|nr:HAMP domain-containing sensor histidine kinase [Pseudomonadota bacterium]